MDRRGAILRGVILGLAVVLVTRSTDGGAQGAGRALATRAPVVQDVTGKVLGPVVGLDQLGGTNGDEITLATVALEVGDQAVLLGVTRDRYVNVPLLTAVDGATGIRGESLNILFFAEAGCTGAAFIASGSGGIPAPSALRRAAIGPGNILYVESGPFVEVPTVSSFFAGSVAQCLALPSPVKAVPADPEVDLDDLFTPPFSVRFR
jgi:hypothetical protein